MVVDRLVLSISPRVYTKGQPVAIVIRIVHLPLLIHRRKIIVPIPKTEII